MSQSRDELTSKHVVPVRKTNQNVHGNETESHVVERQAAHRKRIQAIAKAVDSSSQAKPLQAIPLYKPRSDREQKTEIGSLTANQLRIEQSNRLPHRNPSTRDRHFLSGLVNHLSRLEAGRTETQLSKKYSKQGIGYTGSFIKKQGVTSLMKREGEVIPIKDESSRLRSQGERISKRRTTMENSTSHREEPRKYHFQVIECIVSHSWHLK
jgi:hypothetical protein